MSLVASLANPSDPSAPAISSAPLTQSYVESSPDPFVNNSTTTVTGTSQTDSGFSYTEYAGGSSGGQSEQILLSGGYNNVTLNVVGINYFVGETASSNNIIMGDPYASSNTILLNGASTLTEAITQVGADTMASGQRGDVVATGEGDDTIVGGNGNSVYLAGEMGNNVIYTGAGNDTVWTGYDVPDGVGSLVDQFNWSASVSEIESDSVTYGNNTIDVPILYAFNDTSVGGTGASGTYTPGSATVVAGNGNDFINLPNGADYVLGGSGQDTIMGGDHGDTIFAGSGTDTIEAGAGSNYIDTGTGNDLVVAGGTYLTTETTNDSSAGGSNTVIGGGGNDTIFASEPPGSAFSSVVGGNNYVDGGSGDDVIFGWSNSDTLIAGSGNSTIYGGSGSESIVGGSGNDWLQGGTGTDTIEAGGAGNDTLLAVGSSGSTSYLYGGAGSDTIQGGSGINILYAGDGGTAADPTQVIADPTDATATTTIYGGLGVDELFGGPGSAVIYAGDGGTSAAPTSVVAGAGNVTIYGGLGVDHIFGGSGTEVLYAGDGGESVSPTTVVAGSGTETLYGGAGAAVLGDTTGGADQLFAGSGDDTLISTGTDTLTAGSGADYFSAASGNESYVFDPGFTDDVVDQSGGTANLEFGSGVDPADFDITAGLTSAGQMALEIDDEGTVDVLGGLSGAVGTVDLAGSAYTLDQLIRTSGVGYGVDQTLQGASGVLTFSADDAASLATNANAADTISAWGANDTISVSQAGDQGSTVFVGGDDAQVTGGSGADSLTAAGTGDSIAAGGGAQTLVATGSDDVLTGGSGQDTLSGLGTGDTLLAGSGVDTLIAGSGSDLLTGKAADTYLLNTGFGNIEISGTGGVVEFGSGIAISDLTASVGFDSASGASLMLSSASGGTVTVDGALAGVADEYQISDAAPMTLAQLLSQLDLSSSTTSGPNGNLIIDKESSASIQGGTGNDTIYAVGDNDTLTAGTGNQRLAAVGNGAVLIGGSAADSLCAGTGDATIHGGSGADTIEGGSGTTTIFGGTGLETYVYNLGDGSDTISENTTSVGSDTLQFGAGIDPSDLTYTYNAASNNLVIGFGALSNATLTVQGFAAVEPNQHQISTLTFADGTTLTQSQIIQQDVAIYGTTGDDVLTGTVGPDYFDGKGGNDDEFGHGGSDTFVFNSGYGHLDINESYTSDQQPVLQLGTGIAASALNVTTDGSNLMLADGVSGDEITLDGMWSTPFDGVAEVQLADGTTLTRSQLFQMEMAGTTGNDTIYGTSGADYLDGKGGSDSIIGEGGSDTFTFNAGYGDLDIAEDYSSGQTPVLQLGAGVTESELHVTVGFSLGTDGYSEYPGLILTDGTAGDQITLEGMLGSDPDFNGIAELQLANGTTLTAAQLIQMELTGTSGNDTIYGTPGADLIDGKGGDDLVYAAGGSDTFVFNAGYGELTINEDYSSGQAPVLQLGSGITASALHVTSDGTDLMLTDGVSGDEITLGGMLANEGSEGVAEVQLAGGTTLTAAQLIQMEMAGTPGDDTIYGTPGADLIDGKGGNDSVNGEGGSDTFTFNAGYGDLEINESYASGQNPILQLGPGITASALHVTSNGESLMLTDGVSGDQITLDGMFAYEGRDGVANVQLAGGTTLTAAQLIQMEMIGTTGNDAIYGTSGADSIDGKGGDDFVDGNGGSDTFVFNPGYGDLEIDEGYSSGQQPVLQLGAGITESALQVTNNGMDLFLTDGVTGDKITLDGMYAHGQDTPLSSGVALVELADGTTLTAAQLIQMPDKIIGTTGNDTLTGTSDADYFDGNGGDDDEIGNGGNDTFIFNSGYGELTIDESYTSGQQPVLQLGAGISASALHVTTDGQSLFVTDGIAGDQITLDFMFDAGFGVWSPAGVALVQFADGTTLTGSQLQQMEMTGTPGNDAIIGTTGADLIDGKGGSDTVNGEGGNDTFVFNAGYGYLQINESEDVVGEQAVLELGAGITASALHVTTDGVNLFLSDGIAGDEIQLQDMWYGTQYGVASVQLADGTTLTAAELMQMEMAGTTGDDTIYGTSGADSIDGRGGNDSIIGNGGSDTFVYNAGYGDLVINEGYSSGQEPVLQLGEGIAASALKVTASGNDLVLTDGVSGDEITLQQAYSDNGVYGVAEVLFADGTTLTAAQLLQLSHDITGTTGNDTLTGTSGADLIDGKGGSDSVVGDGGNDTFLFDSGYGQLTINEHYKSGQQPVLELGAGITTSTLQATKSGNNLVLSDGVSGDAITLYDMWSSSTYGVAEAQLADGTVLTRSQLIQMEMTGTTGNDTIYGTTGADLIDGKGGNDSVIGDGGNDTFVFDSGYGHLTINEVYKTGQQPVLDLGTGITESTLHVTSNGTNLMLADGVTGDLITLDSMWKSSTSGIATVQLADGATITRDQLIQMEMTGTTGNDTIYGTSGADLVDGKSGSDSVIGEGGNDTFMFDSGYGHLTINETFTSGQTPVLELGSGITAATLRVTSNGTNLILTDSVSGDQVTLDSMWTSNTRGVATVQLADGTTFTASQLIQMEMTGTTGNDTIYGTSGADLIDGKGGSDSVIGKGGNDTFVFDSGYGHLTINEAFTTGQTPVLELGAGITESILQVTTSGNNLLLKDGVTGDQITLVNMATSSTNGVATVELADGTTLTRSQLLGMETTSMAIATPAASPGEEGTNNTALAAGVAGGSLPRGAVSSNAISPQQAGMVESGGTRLAATPSIASAGGHLGSPLQSSGAASHTSTPAETVPSAGAQLPPQPADRASKQPSSIGDDPAQQASAPSPMSPLDPPRLESRPLVVQTLSESEATVAPGAPTDPLTSDFDDPVGGAAFSLATAVRPGVPRSLGTGAQSGLFAPAFGQRQLASTTRAADAMVRALIPRNTPGSSLIGNGFVSETEDEIRLQGGESWSRSSVDRTLAALPSTGSGMDDLSSRLTDMAHAQLISAMATFRPDASAESLPTVPANLDTYTIAAAVGIR